MDSLTLASAMNITSARAAKWAPALAEAMLKGKINTRLRMANFLAQVGHETMSLTFVKELGGDQYLSKYDTGALAKRLGNTPEADGDGQKYRGRGLIQVTGRANYLACSKALFGDERLLATPELLELPQWAAESAVWFWTRHNLNELADKDMFTATTKVINGGTNGLEDRKERYRLALSVLK